MKTMPTKIIIILLLFVSLKTTAQTADLTGVWTGFLYVDSTKQYLPYEMIFSEEKGAIKGFSRIVFEHDGKKEVGIRDIFAVVKNGKIIIEDEDFIESDFSVYVPKRIKKTMVMDLEVKDTAMMLTGTWSTNKTRVFLSATGTGSFSKKINFKESALYQRLDTLKKTNNLSFTKPKPAEPVAIVPKVEEVPDLNIPALENMSPLELLALNQTKKPGIKIQPFSKQQRQLFEGLAKTTIKYVPKQEPTPPVVVAKPAPITVSKPVEPKPIPVVSAPPVVKKEEKIIVTPSPAVVVEKKLPPPAPIIAPSVQQGAAEIDKRAVKVEQALYFDNDSLVLTLYDNGEVDGDTVTILMNGNIIFSKQGLSTKANTKVVYVPKEADSVKLIMYAESLGEIPPNTGLMVVMDGEKRYDLRFSADLKTSAAIVFRRRIK